MYIQITTRCNMTCEHCCYSCTAKGQDMSRATFLSACKLANDRGESISIGGGEPTIHPLFWDFIGIALAHSDPDEMVPWLATNGKKTEDALRLARLARSGVLSVDLSQDEYHDRIDPKVIAAFQKPKDSAYCQTDRRDYRRIRSVKNIVNAGRADENGIYDEEGCCCEALFVKPDGSLFGCGCLKNQLGTLDRPQIPCDYETDVCALKQARKLEEVA